MRRGIAELDGRGEVVGGDTMRPKRIYSSTPEGVTALREWVSQEITRDDFLKSDDATGRKMDFLCQEIHREFNTTGSKSTQIEVTRAVIEGKNALERIREQVQNIE